MIEVIAGLQEADVNFVALLNNTVGLSLVPILVGEIAAFLSDL